MPRAKAVQDIADEIVLYIDNTESIYTSQTMPLWSKLAKKKREGGFSPRVALSNFRRIVADAIPAYRAEIGVPLRPNTNTRILAAEMLLAEFESEFKLGNVA